MHGPFSPEAAAGNSEREKGSDRREAAPHEVDGRLVLEHILEKLDLAGVDRERPHEIIEVVAVMDVLSPSCITRILPAKLMRFITKMNRFKKMLRLCLVAI
jgi:hypothetical protein